MVIWGSNEKDDKILLALELVHDENKVKIYIFPAASVTEVFYNQMMNLWRNGGPVSFPDDHTVIERELSMTDDLLPADIRVERTDLVNRAKTEWHFVVLSAKLRESYNNEIQQFKEKIENLPQFDDGVWEELKGFWDKVQNQVREKNLFREHADELRDNTNNLFSKLKELRKSLNDEFSKISKQHANTFLDSLKEIEKKVNDGLGLHPIFNELKDLQAKFNNTEFTRSDRSHVWKKLDAAFKLVKEKKFGSSGKDTNSADRVNRRYTGLMSAIKKMENSIIRDKKDIEFQNNRIQTTEGQLEMQIRQAKLSMIQERIKSKEEKLTEMLKTKESVEKKMEQEKKKQEKREAEEAKAKAAKTVKVKPADAKSDNTNAPDKTKADSNKVEAVSQNNDDTKATTKASEVDESKQKTDETNVSRAIKDKPAIPVITVPEGTADSEGSKPEPVETPKEEESVVSALSNTVGEAFEDVFDTVKAAAVVLVDKAEEVVEDLLETNKTEEE